MVGDSIRAPRKESVFFKAKRFQESASIHSHTSGRSVKNRGQDERSGQRYTINCIIEGSKMKENPEVEASKANPREKLETEAMTSNQDELDTNLAFGIVIRAPIDIIRQVREYIVNHPDVVVVYNRLSTERLWIVKDGGDLDD